VRRRPDSRESASTRTSSPARTGSTLFASRPTCEAQKVGTGRGRESRGKSARQRSERIVTPTTAAPTAARIQAGLACPIALRTSWKLSPRTASQPKMTETAMPATAATARRTRYLSRKRYLTRATTAGKPSRHVIFLPSS
jgi:hypothetical protein